MKFRDVESDGLGGKDFLRLKDGDTVAGVLRGDPVDFNKHWLNGKSTICTGSADCAGCKASPDRPRFTFRVNFLVKEGDGYVSKIFEQGLTVYNQLKELSADYDLTNTVIKISRKGSGAKDTTYNVLPLPPPKGTVTPELDKKLKTVQLHDLASMTFGGAQPAQAAGREPGEDDVPF